MKREEINTLEELYKGHFGCKPDQAVRLSGAGGDRIYYRLVSPAGTCIGTIGDSPRDCEAFIGLDRAFNNAGIRVPEIYGVSSDGNCYLQQDLGDVSLFSLIGSDAWRTQMELSLEEIARVHALPEEIWMPRTRYAPFSLRQVMWDLNYFKYEYLRAARVPFDEDKLEDDFEYLAKMLAGSASGPYGFMMRDFQSRNVMVHDGKPYLIDFQGGRFGPVVYDVVSMLWQAKAAIIPSVRMELAEFYAVKYSELTGIQVSWVLDAVPLLALFRTLQVLGAYGFRGIVQHRAHFVESIAPALDNVAEMLGGELLNGCPELTRALSYAVAHSPIPRRHEGLLVKVFSFSYKRGYPEDMTGNGGGFMFDCRGMHNPGRYDEFKPLTGLDAPVREFLEAKGEVHPFLDHAVDMVSPAVSCYLRRGFSDLQVGFGCTGGRHRSVYCADTFAHRIKQLHPEATVCIIHREQDIIQEL